MTTLPLEALYELKQDDYFQRSRPEMLPFVPLEARRILDVGCGAGYFAGVLKKERNAEVWGVELNGAAAEEARGRIDQVFHAGFGPGLSLPVRSFDAICFNDVLEHVADPGELLRYARTLLVPGGCVIASLPNFRHFENIWKLVVKKTARYEDAGIMDRTHLRIFTQASIPALFAEADLELVSLTGINAHLVKRKFKLLNAITLGAISDMRYLQFAVVAKVRD